MPAKGCRPHAVDGYETGGLDVARAAVLLDGPSKVRMCRDVGFREARGRRASVPVVGVRPGADPVTPSDADAVARTVPRGAVPGAGPRVGVLPWPNVELASIR
ncbi:hypothetical protein GCM10010300_01210 [Streptomyces olivaceoviridis]|nr:hypothetical protein GCM10010300_01210 [Streptomyces olivaceoviridis]